ncbi:MAG: ABC-2 family transporter protein [Chloroflexi bacterium]|nr:ABC-2 family transporter protein [Chloroflexota bacterium]
MASRWRNLPAYFQLMALWPQLFAAYRFNIVFEIVGLLLQVFLLKTVWTAVYAGRPIVSGLPLPTLIAYLTLTNLQLWVMWPQISQMMQERIREGLVALDMARPVGFLQQMYCHQLGGTLAIGPFFLLTLPFAWLVGGLTAPASPASGALYVVSVLLGYLIGMLVALLTGLIAFWTLEASGITMIQTFVAQFFAGALVPIWFFPPALLVVAKVLPFQSEGFVPVAIYLGQLEGSAALRALGLQVFWVVALAALARLVWSRAHRRVVVQGG